MDALVVRLLLLLTLLLGASPASAAWSFVSGAVTTGAADAVTKTVTAGNLICVGYATGNNPFTLTISDGVNAWTSIDKANDVANLNVAQWWFAVAATSASITVTISGGAAAAVDVTWIAEWSGNATSSVLGTHAVNTGAAGTTGADATTSTSFVTAEDGDLIVGWVMDASALDLVAQYTQGTGYTKRATASNDPGGAAVATTAVEDKVQATKGSVAATWTSNAADAYNAFGAAFKAPAGGTTTPERSKMGVGT